MAAINGLPYQIGQFKYEPIDKIDPQGIFLCDLESCVQDKRDKLHHIVLLIDVNDYMPSYAMSWVDNHILQIALNKQGLE